MEMCHSQGDGIHIIRDLDFTLYTWLHIVEDEKLIHHSRHVPRTKDQGDHITYISVSSVVLQSYNAQ